MMNSKLVVRIIAIVMAVLMFGGVFIGVITSFI